jgi:hypothetical protein
MEKYNSSNSFARFFGYGYAHRNSTVAARDRWLLVGKLQDDVSMTSLAAYFPAVRAKSHRGCLGDKAG